MSQYTDELFNGISPELTHRIELFLANANLEHQQKLELISALNDAYVEGYEGIIQYAKDERAKLEAASNDWMQNLQDKLNASVAQRINGSKEGD